MTAEELASRVRGMPVSVRLLCNRSCLTVQERAVTMRTVGDPFRAGRKQEQPISRSCPVSANLDEEAVRHVAHLARLTVSDDQVALFIKQLSSILDYVGQFSELDTSETPPTAHPLPVFNVFRDDRTAEPLKPAEALGNAPRQQNGFFCVPRVLDQDSA